MSIKKVIVVVDESLGNSEDDNQSTLVVEARVRGEKQAGMILPRGLSPEEVAEEFKHTAEEFIEDPALSLRGRRLGYELNIEAASNVPGLRK